MISLPKEELPNSVDQQQKNVRRLLWGSLAFLLLFFIGGSSLMFCNLSKQQSNVYTAIPWERQVFSQPFGLEHGSDLASARSNQHNYFRATTLIWNGMSCEATDPAKAESLYRDALEALQKYPGINNSYAAICLQQLADNLERRGKYDQEEEVLQQLVSCCEASTNTMHRTVAQALSELGDFYQTRDKYAHATAAYKRAYEIDSSGAGKDSRAAVNDLYNLALVDLYRGCYQQAREKFQESLQISTQCHYHGSMRTSAEGIATIDLRQKNFSSASQFWRLAQSNLTDRDTKESRCRIACWLSWAEHKSGNEAQAKASLDECLRNAEVNAVPTTELCHIADIMLAMKDYNRVLPIVNAWLATAECKFGEENTELFELLLRKASCSQALHQEREVQACVLRMLEIAHESSVKGETLDQLIRIVERFLAMSQNQNADKSYLHSLLKQLQQSRQSIKVTSDK